MFLFKAIYQILLAVMALNTKYKTNHKYHCFLFVNISHPPLDFPLRNIPLLLSLGPIKVLDSKNVCVKMTDPSVKISRFLPVKKIYPYVKFFLKVPVKAPDCAWKFYKFCAWKPLFVREKTEINLKKPFHAHFFLSRTKKNTAPGYMKISEFTNWKIF